MGDRSKIGGARRRRGSPVAGIVLAALVAAGLGVLVGLRRAESPRGGKPPVQSAPSRAASAAAARGHAEVEGATAPVAPAAQQRRAEPPPSLDTTPALALEGPYEDPLQARIDFGRHSYYLTPWRAYMDTWPASRLLECIGFGFNCEPREAEAVAQVIAEAGARSARVEIGWGNFRYDDPSRLPPHREEELRTTLQALRRRGIRPLILLNAHHGVPCPMRWFDASLAREARQGEREIVLDKLDDIRPGYTGLTNLTDYLAAFPIITKADAATKRCELSAPLPKTLPAGRITLSLLRYQPFAGPVFADGRPNPASRETLEGWMTYVGAVCRYAKEFLGTDGAPDAGFDLEVWNEYTFGSNFLDINRYYDPPLGFAEPISYSNRGRTAKGSEAILPMTVDYANDPRNRCPGVNVLSGFSNQRPWDNGSEMWPGQAGFSRHYYTGISLKDHSPENPKFRNSGPLNALGRPDGTPDGKDWHTVLPGSFFVPVVNVSMPEYWHYGYQTEFMTRDVQPFPSTSGGPVSFAHHHRYSHPGTGRPAQVWMTEFNLDRGPWAEHIAREAGCKPDDPRLAALLHRVGAKSTLRSFVMHSHKGVHTVNMFAIKCSDRDLGVIPEAFYKALGEEGYKLTDRVRAEAGPQLAALARATRLMRDSRPIETARPLKVERLVEREPRVVFRGDGTPEHPDRTHKDDFACLPYQLDERRFAIAYYVVTRNIVKVWDGKKDLLDPARYDMPEQEFDLTLSNVRGEGAKLSAYDPLADRTVPAGLLAATAASLAVRVRAVDYPRFLVIEEARPGPLVLAPRVAKKGPGGAEVSFESNVAARATVSAGPFPLRRPVELEGEWKGGFLLGEYYSGKEFESIRMRRMDPGVDFDWNAGGPGQAVGGENFSVRWTGQVEAELGGPHVFHTAADDGTRLWVDGRLVIDDWTYHAVVERSATVELEAGRRHDIRLEYFQGGGGAAVRLMWTPPGRAKETIPPSRLHPPPVRALEPVGAARSLSVEPGRRCSVPLPEGKDFAVRILLEHEGLVARWPLWDWDVRGVLGFAEAGHLAPGPTEGARISLPELPPSARARSWRLAPGGLAWKGPAHDRTAQTASGLQARLRFVEGELEAVTRLLPALSVSDSQDVKVVTWGGAPAWRIDLALDPAAHPGTRDLAQRFYVAPVGNGFLVLSVGSPRRPSEAELEAVASGVRLE